MAEEYNKTPYLLRQSGDGQLTKYNTREIDKIIGGTVAWNQLADVNDGTISRNGVTASYSNNILTLTGTASPQALLPICNSNTKIIQGHKYLLRGNLQNTSYDTGALYMNNSGAYVWDYGNGCIFTANESSNAKSITIMIPNGVDATGMKFCPQLTDLTALFGSAEIADYVYSLEQTTAGAGVAWLKSHGFITKDYYAYDSGSLKSVKTSAHVTRGFNQFNKSDVVPNSTINSSGVVVSGSYNVSGMFKVIPNTNYYVKDVIAGNMGRGVCVYDSEGIFIKALVPDGSVSRTYGQVTTPTNAFYMRVMTDNTDVCVVNISDASKNGQYEPYESHSYQLDSDLELRGIPKLDSSNNLYYDGDVYESSGNVSRKYGIVDLGTIDWTSGGQNKLVFSSGISSLVRKVASNANVANWIIASKFEPISYNAISTTTAGRICITTDGLVGICDGNTYSSASDFKTAMSGTYLVFEKAQSSTEQADPYANPQVVNPLGTEEYVDTRDVPVPVGHETFYPVDAGYGDTLISDLPAFGSTIGPNDYLVLDNGRETMKVSAIDLVTQIVNSMNS